MDWTRIAGISGALAVGFGAFGYVQHMCWISCNVSAHGLRARVADERILKAFETGAHYVWLKLLRDVLIALSAFNPLLCFVCLPLPPKTIFYLRRIIVSW